MSTARDDRLRAALAARGTDHERIAEAQPRLASRIVRAILKVETARYRTDECRNVALGHAIRTLERLVDRPEDRGPILRFVRRQLGNTRPSTRKAAEALLRRAGRGAASR